MDLVIISERRVNSVLYGTQFHILVKFSGGPQGWSMDRVHRCGPWNRDPYIVYVQTFLDFAGRKESWAHSYKCGSFALLCSCV